MLTAVRETLLSEARSSPSLLADLAGLEQYVAESYQTRALIELLQNADDAGATRILVQKQNQFLFVANDGRAFSVSDFESLCRSAASGKQRGDSIGYRGIGFKSVVSIASEVLLFSGDLSAIFSRELTKQAVPMASRVPLLRIPHPVTDSHTSYEMANRLLKSNFNTVFVFTGIDPKAVQIELDLFEVTSLLFLRNIRHAEVIDKTPRKFNVLREKFKHHSAVTLEDASATTHWHIASSRDISIAFRLDQQKVMPLVEEDAVVHAFLPTEEPTGLRCKINGDFSTDPSRRRVLLDQRSSLCIKNVAALIVDLMLRNITANQELGILGVLIPTTDPRIHLLQRQSFQKELMAAIKEAAAGKFEHIRLCPIWLNSQDFQSLSKEIKLLTVPSQYFQTEGLSNWLKYLGAREATFQELSEAFTGCTITQLGAAQFLVYLANQHVLKQIPVEAISKQWKIWFSDNQPRSLTELLDKHLKLDESFIYLVCEQASNREGLVRLLQILRATAILPELLPVHQSLTALSGQSNSLDISSPKLPNAIQSDAKGIMQSSPLSARKWRSAEQQVLEILTQRNWALDDVSKQNIGYDLGGTTDAGAEVAIEVKSIDFPGQSFTLTTNEEVVARMKGDKYILAIVRQTETHLQVCFIQNPIPKLQLTRQCRQWVWQCDTYLFEPQEFPLL